MKIHRILLFAGIIILSSCTDKNLVTQKIQGAGDCTYCESQWSWNNGTATVGDPIYWELSDGSDYSPQFNFRIKISGEMSFSYKINDDYLGDIRVQSKGGVSFSDNETGPSKWTLVKAGHVDAGYSVVFQGRYCSVKDIVIVGTIEENTSQGEHHDPMWDF